MQDACFGGVLHAHSPYERSASTLLSLHDSARSALGYMPDAGSGGTASPLASGPGLAGDEGEEGGRAGTPVGPVAGGIMGCFIVLALGIYCYRHRALTRAGGRHPYHQALPGGGGGGVGAGFEELLEGEDDPPDDASLALAQFESNPAGISPYRVSTGYRRPPPDSDHGYR